MSTPIRPIVSTSNGPVIGGAYPALTGLASQPGSSPGHVTKWSRTLSIVCLYIQTIDTKEPSPRGRGNRGPPEGPARGVAWANERGRVPRSDGGARTRGHQPR